MSSRVHIWVDGDSCPVPVRALLVRTARRRGLPVTFCANRPLPIEYDTDDPVELRVVTDSTVDEYLLANTEGENETIHLVITRDIPLAESLVERGVSVMNDRGRLFRRETIRELRSLRDAHALIRDQGLEKMNTANVYGAREQKAFADTLDRFLARAYPENADT